jgi:hypothetical protein
MGSFNMHYQRSSSRGARNWDGKELSTVQNFISGTGTQMCYHHLSRLFSAKFSSTMTPIKSRDTRATSLVSSSKTRMNSYLTYEESVSRKAIYVDIKLDGITKSLNGISTRLSFYQMRVKISLRFLDSIEQSEKYFRRDDNLAPS